MLKKTERRMIARELKLTKLSLPLRFRIARMVVSGKAGCFADALEQLGAKKEVLPFYCECCGPSDYKFTIEEKEVFTTYGRFDKVAHTPIPKGGFLYRKDVKLSGLI